MNTATQTETETASAPTTLRLRGRDFSVTTQQTAAQGTMYVLTGKRGAVYGTMRNRNHPTQMFVIHAGRGFGIPAGFEGVWLSDESGKLEVLRD